MSGNYCGAPPYDRKWIRSLELIISGAIAIYLLLLDSGLVWVRIFPELCLAVIFITTMAFIVTFIDWLEKMIRFYQTNIVWPTFVAMIIMLYSVSAGILILFLPTKAKVLPAFIFICVGLLIYGYDLIWELWFLAHTKNLLHYIDFENSYAPQQSGSYVTSYDDRDDCECDVAPTYTARGDPQATNTDLEAWTQNEEIVPSHGGTFHVSTDVVPISITPKSLQPPSPKRMRKNSDLCRTVSIQTRTQQRSFYK